MHKISLILGVLAALALPAEAAPKKKPAKTSTVAHATPEVAWIGAGGKAYPLKNLRGQPVVILIAPSPDTGALRKEAGRIEDLYLDFAAKKTVFIAAFTSGQGRVESNVPYAIAADGATAAAIYGVDPKEFSVVVIGPDGNVDMVSKKVEGAQRILDIINNSFQPQAAGRAGLGG